MNEEIKNRIRTVKSGKAPDGYVSTEYGVFPSHWRLAELREIAHPLTETAGTRKIETVSISAGIGFVNQAEKFGKELSGKQYEKYIVLHRGDFSYNKGNSNLYPQGCTYRLNDREIAAVPNVFESFRIVDGDPDYYEQLFLSGFLNHQLFRKINHGVRDDGLLNLTDADFYSCVLPVPPIEEQHRIAEILSACDRMLALHKKALSEAKEMKKSFLNKMFPKDGACYPELRFVGFTGAWEQRKVGDFANVLSASRVHKDEWAIEGVPFFRSSDVVSAYKGTPNEKAFITKSLYEELAKASGKLEQDDILITGGGSIGIPYIVPNDDPLYSKDADLIWIKKSAKHDSRYLYAYFSSQSFRDYICSISHVGTIAHYTIEQVKDTPIFLPEMAEQKAVGFFFSRLDTLITLHRREVELQQNKKKALMQLLLTGLVPVS